MLFLESMLRLVHTLAELLLWITPCCAYIGIWVTVFKAGAEDLLRRNIARWFATALRSGAGKLKKKMTEVAIEPISYQQIDH